jgi:indolepyruvate ferredoxin oxidoreductase
MIGLEMTALAERGHQVDASPVLSGVQALARVGVEWQRWNHAAGNRTAMLLSGYQGSPLGGLDLELARHRRLLDELDIVLRPGLNEELAATALWGSQLASAFPGARVEGVSGMWYGKAPGLDRAADAIRHGNYIGVGSRGGVLVAVGDDPSCKSSSLPSASEATLAALNLPTLYPATVAEVLSFGLHALACSRTTGTWVALKMTTDVADGIATLPAFTFDPILPDVVRHDPNGRILAPDSVAMERSLFEVRLPAAVRYAAHNRLNEISGADQAWLGIVAAGKTWTDLQQALVDLGVGDDELERLGVRLLKIGMVHPLDREIVERFADGLVEILVLEEKQPFLEPAIREQLYGSWHRPRIRGKADLPLHGELDQDVLAPLLAEVLGSRAGSERFRPRLEQLAGAARVDASLELSVRSPVFCSGCPHNRSTTAPDGALVGAGIGCHSLVLVSPDGRGELTTMTQMGGEGAQWIGIAPFIEPTHVFQNVGDGTFHHSGSLALRAAVAAGVDVTFKLLYNGAVAMTGGQSVPGGLDVPSLTRLLEAEGVVRTIVTTDDPARYRRLRLASNASVRHRDRLDEAHDDLAGTPGVTVLVHDQQCAIEKRRSWRQLPNRRKTRVVIDERVCEGCGDCVRSSSCVSLVPVETEFGSKMHVHDPSCNEDLSCLLGDCPSFLTVEVDGSGPPRALPAAPPPSAVPPVGAIADDFRIRLVGIGGTGTVTLNRILADAAVRAGFAVVGLDQTGLSQKGGAVVSDLTIQPTQRAAAGRASAASVDLYLGLDIVGAASSRYLRAASTARTGAVVSTKLTPTGAFVSDPTAPLPRLDALRRRIARYTRADSSVYFDAGRLSEHLFADHLPAGLILLGAAWQQGLLPLPLAALEQAVGASGLDSERSLLAFAWGRAAVARPDALYVEPTDTPVLTAAERELVASAGFAGALLRVVERRVPELVAFQSLDQAREYVAFLAQVADWEQTALGGLELTAIVAERLFTLMAYKDEYEVARLHLLGWKQRGHEGKVRWHLHPPLLRALGLKRKIRVGRWILPLFRVLVALRGLRGTAFDPFGWVRLRRVERALPDEYRQLLLTAFAHPAAAAQRELLRELCDSPSAIKGYEDIKLAAIEDWRVAVAEYLAALAPEQSATAA